MNNERRPSILFVEDDVYSSMTYVDELRDKGFDVTVAEGADEAIQLTSSGGFDLMVTDLRMLPGARFSEMETAGGQRTGLALARYVRRQNPQLPILLLTLALDQEVRLWCTPANRAEYLRKQTTLPSQLASRVLRSLRDHRHKPNVFIVHGHNHTLLRELKDYVQNTLGLGEARVLMQKPSGITALLEKFRSHAAEIDIAFVLLTPDDSAAAKSKPSLRSTRARQNVILELGYFLSEARHSDCQVLLLNAGVDELPSDIAGLVPIDVSAGIAAAGEHIRVELARWL